MVQGRRWTRTARAQWHHRAIYVSVAPTEMLQWRFTLFPQRWQFTGCLKNPPSTPFLSVQHKHTGNADNLYCWCGCAAECKRHKHLLWRWWKAGLKRTGRVAKTQLFSPSTAQVDTLLLFSSHKLSRLCELPAWTGPSASPHSSRLLSHALRQTGLTGWGVGGGGG